MSVRCEPGRVGVDQEQRQPSRDPSPRRCRCGPRRARHRTRRRPRCSTWCPAAPSGRRRRVAVVEMLWLLDPASGSVMAKAIFSPATSRGSQAWRCSSVPKRVMSSAQMAVDTRMSSSGQPWAASSSHTIDSSEMPCRRRRTPRAGARRGSRGPTPPATARWSWPRSSRPRGSNDGRTGRPAWRPIHAAARAPGCRRSPPFAPFRTQMGTLDNLPPWRRSYTRWSTRRASRTAPTGPTRSPCSRLTRSRWPWRAPAAASATSPATGRGGSCSCGNASSFSSTGTPLPRAVAAGGVGHPVPRGRQHRHRGGRGVGGRNACSLVTIRRFGAAP